MAQTATPLKAVDFFCGAGGMSYGLHRAGIQILAGLDNSVDCRRTYLANIPGAKYIRHDITTLTAPELGRRLKIARDDANLIFCGCSPCQFWSKIRTDKTKSARTAFLLHQFKRFIKYFRPGFIVVENVPGLYTRKEESILSEFIVFLDNLGYNFCDGVINANHYGVPQNRMRYLLIASRVVKIESLPKAETDSGLCVRHYLGPINGFHPIPAGHRDATAFLHTAAALSEKNLQRISMTRSSGGDRSAWAADSELQIDAYRDRDRIFRDVYGRMSWDRPAPTITTRFISLSNGRFGHPDEDRAISIREGATLQTFPKEFEFHASAISSFAKQIGNAVPPELARRIGTYLISARHA
jgi:DNA (cytosine-5)-methyltransferase 1